MIKYLRIILFATLGLGAALFTVSCDKDMSISLDNENIDNLNVTSDDTLSAVVSTVQMPNIPTSGTGVILVGKFAQPVIGSLKSTSYFRINPTGITSDIPTNATFDSLNLILRPSYSKFVYGDTTKFQTLTAHRLTQSLETKTIDNSLTGLPLPLYITGPAIFGQQKFNYASEALGSVRFLPHINKIDSVSMRLDDVLGKEFFSKIKSSDIAFNSSTNFQEYFKGLSLVSDDQNSAMVAFSDTLQVKVNYSYIGTDGFKKNASKVLNMTEKAYQYNQLENDLSETSFEGLSTTKSISSESTNGVAFIQAGTGVAAEIKFPALRDFIQQSGVAINKAELEIEIEGSHLGFYPPAVNPVLFIADARVPISFVREPFTNQIQAGTYLIGNSLGKKGRYVFNLIEYIKTATDPNAQDRSLFLTMSPPSLFYTGYTTVLATQNNKPNIKLNIVYTKFK